LSIAQTTGSLKTPNLLSSFTVEPSALPAFSVTSPSESLDTVSLTQDPDGTLAEDASIASLLIPDSA
jgi:hypothetical protein